MTLSKVLVANRGEIAVRVARACADLGIRSVAAHSEPDAAALHVRVADEAVLVGPAPAAASYLNIGSIVAAARRCGADAVHPGYGFLSENAAFARAVEEAGLVFVGPPSAAIASMGDKVVARRLAGEAGVPLVPGTTSPVVSAHEIVAFGAEHGYPVVVKAAYGGGGRGMRIIESEAGADGALATARAEALSAFGVEDVYLERYLRDARHVEVQLLADRHGNTVWLGDRDCSVQRRHQKVIEEAPAPGLGPHVRRAMGEAAVRLAEAVSYVGAGTVEFLVSGEAFYFLEMNTRIQVEHPITDLILGTDLVVEQLRIADGEPLRSTASGPEPRGHAIEVRVNAEDTTAGRFMPAPGKITELVAPSLPGVRFDSGYEAGDEVSPFYDGLIGKLVVWAPDRPTAIRRALSALRSTRIEGVRTTIGAAVAILGHPDYAGFRMTTQWLESHTDVLPAAGARSVDEAAAAAVDATTTGAPADGADAGRPAGDRSAVVVAGRRYVVPFHGDAASASESAFGRRCGPGALQRSSRPAVAERLHRPVAGTTVGSGPPASPRTAGRAGATGGASVPIAEWTAERNVPAGGGVTSPMQGSVVEVAVRPGQQVAAGGRLFVIEAMKMQNPVTAGEAGTVGEIFVAVGDTVRAGEMLASFDRGPGSAAGQLGG